MVKRMSDINSNNSDDQNNYQAVYSLRMATELCADYPFFTNLITIRKNHKYPNRRVWFFKRTAEFDEVFEQLKAEAIKARQDRENEINDFDKDVVVSE